jgi:hypothetical protein
VAWSPGICYGLNGGLALIMKLKSFSLKEEGRRIMIPLHISGILAGIYEDTLIPFVKVVRCKSSIKVMSA